MMSSPPSQFNYPLPKVGITASQVGKRITVPLGGSFQQSVWIELSNESPYLLSILDSQGILLNQLQPQLVDIAQIPSGDSLFFIIPNLLIPQASPSSEVDINVYPFGKPEGAYPFPLNRQSSPVYSSGPIGFSSSVGASVSIVNGIFAMSCFNPVSNARIAQFYKAEFRYTDTGNTTALVFSTTSDPNLPTGITPTPQTTRANIVASGLHCTWSGNATLVGLFLRQMQVSNLFIWNGMTDPRDFIEVVPGSGIFVAMSSVPSTTSVNTLNTQWTEQ